MDFSLLLTGAPNEYIEKDNKKNTIIYIYFMLSLWHRNILNNINKCLPCSQASIT
jgi:hypothetical protein